jgi:hypothetical protein
VPLQEETENLANRVFSQALQISDIRRSPRFNISKLRTKDAKTMIKKWFILPMLPIDWGSVKRPDISNFPAFGKFWESLL